jgi:hypothetical protein
LRAAGASGDPGEALFVRSTLFDRRGLSVDTSLLPNYALKDTLAAMLRRGAAPKRFRRIAAIGPGLDFADKRDGYDFYPLQTTQPFTVVDAAFRLELGNLDDLRLVGFDLNPAVNAHVRQLAAPAREGRPPYCNFLASARRIGRPPAVAYWQHFGDRIGSPVASAAEPKGGQRAGSGGAAEICHAHRIAGFESGWAGHGWGGVPSGRATNILVYYDPFQQAIAMAGIARMMNTDRVFLSNTVPPAQRPAALEYLQRHSVTYSGVEKLWGRYRGVPAEISAARFVKAIEPRRRGTARIAAGRPIADGVMGRRPPGAAPFQIGHCSSQTGFHRSSDG